MSKTIFLTLILLLLSHSMQKSMSHDSAHMIDNLKITALSINETEVNQEVRSIDLREILCSHLDLACVEVLQEVFEDSLAS